MKLSEFKKLVNSIPSEFDDYNIIYSEMKENDEDSYIKIDDELSGVVSDDENKTMCFMGKDSYELAKQLYQK